MTADSTHSKEARDIYHIHANWDPEAEVWYVSDTDVPGLATEAASLELLSEKLRVVIPELLAANELLPAHPHAVSFELIGHRQESIRLAS